MDRESLLLSERLESTIVTSFPEQGKQWLEQLPSLLEECAQRWSLTLLPPFPNLSFHYVTPALCADGTEVVLKVGVPDRESVMEVAALRRYEGRNCVYLLDADDKRDILLLEWLRPGRALTTLADEENDTKATAIAASVMRGLWRPALLEDPFPSVYDWADGMKELRLHFGGGVGPFPVALIEEAESLFTELLASMSTPVLLHGDLHHDNILASERLPWVAVDPKGLIGEPAYEVGALLRNLWGDRHVITNPKRIMERRIDQLSEELNIDRARIRGWGVAQAVLSAWWSVDDEDCRQGAVSIAELIASVR